MLKAINAILEEGGEVQFSIRDDNLLVRVLERNGLAFRVVQHAFSLAEIESMVSDPEKWISEKTYQLWRELRNAA